jgi:hypothetical protein
MDQVNQLRTRLVLKCDFKLLARFPTQVHLTKNPASAGQIRK